MARSPRSKSSSAPFVGRAEEIETVCAMMEQHRLLTLTGAGGTGKSAMACEIVRRHEKLEHAVSVDWVDVSGASASLNEAVPPASEGPHLLILDGCEHRAEDARVLIERVLAEWPRTRILATSRDAFGVPGECAWPVQGLSPSDARRLFVVCARAASPLVEYGPADEAAIDRICARLGGRPAAIEMAASRVTALSPTELAERLEDAWTILTAGGDAHLPRPRTILSAASLGDAPALRVRALGLLEIERFGQPLPRGAWRYARPRELLLYLLCHRRGRTRAQIGLAFWPEASPEQVKNNVHVALHRLRTVLEDPTWVVFEDGIFRMNPRIEIDFDAEWFETGVASALKELSTPTGRRHGAATVDRLAALLDSWRGDFLESEEVGDWHLSIRDRLAHLHLEALSVLANSRLEYDDLEGAHAAFEAVIAVDEWREDAYRGLMRTRAPLGDRSGALRVYTQLTSVLDEQLGALPDQETAEIVDRLRRGERV